MLLNRPFPKQGELLPQYLVRLSIANGYRSTLMLMKVIGEKLSNTRIPGKRLYFGEFDLEALANVINLDVKRVSACRLERSSETRFQYKDQDFLLKSVSFNFLKVCPYCYAEKPELSLLNSLHMKTACTKHQCLLMTYHPETGKKLNWGTKNLGQDIPSWANSPSLKGACETELAINECIECLWFGRQCHSYHLPEQLNLADYLDVVQFLTLFHHRAYGSQAVRASSANAMTADRYLTRWPDAYFELLDHFQKNPMSSARLNGIRRCYRDLYDDLYSPLNTNSKGYKLLRDYFESYIRDSFSNGALLSSVKWIPKQVVETCKYLNEKQACELLAIPTSKLKVLTRENLLFAFKKLDNGTLLFERNNLLTLKNKLSHCHSLHQAATLFRISDYQMCSLIKAKLVLPLLSPSKDNRDWLIDICQLQYLIRALTEGASKKKVHHAHDTKRFTFYGFDLSRLIKEMLSGNIEYSHTPCTKEPLAIKQFTPIFNANDKTSEDFLTPHDACIALGVNKNVVYDFVKKGLIDGVKQNVNRTARPVLLISKLSISKFKSTYLLRHQRGELTPKDLKTVSGPKVDGGIINVYQRVL